MRVLPSVVRGCLVLGGAVIIALAGCGTAHAPAAGSTFAGNTVAGNTVAGNTVAESTGAATVTAAQSPEQRADADAAAILASFVVPPGATKLPAAPSVGKGVLKQPISTVGDPDLVDDADWWQAPGAPDVVLAWEKAHLPRQFSDFSTGSGWNGTVFIWSDSFELPAIAGVLDSRALLVEAVDGTSGTTDLRVDSQVAWIPARPASEVVPSASRAVTLSLLPNMDSHAPLPAPVTVTNPDQVHALAALIDGLSLFPPGDYNCPAAFGDGLVLTFRARPHGPALAVATINLSGCEGIEFTIGGKQQPGLGGPDGGRPVAARALKITGLHWKLI